VPKRRAGCLLLAAVLLLAAWFGWQEYRRLLREAPELFPWTPLDLADRIGPFTAAKLSAAGERPGQCTALLAAAGLRHRPVPPRRPAEAACGFDHAVELRPGAAAVAYAPRGLVTACPVAAALFLWERDVVQPAARRHLGDTIARIDHFGSVSCRRVNRRPDAAYSEHALANAVDIAGFRTASGRRVSVLADWRGSQREAAFLREVRDGACDVFATTLSPDYNAAHADHFHLDQARRGRSGRRACR
jgi:hypothetical protein